MGRTFRSTALEFYSHPMNYIQYLNVTIINFMGTNLFLGYIHTDILTNQMLIVVLRH